MSIKRTLSIPFSELIAPLNLMMNTSARIRSQTCTFFSLSAITRRQLRLPPRCAIRLLSSHQDCNDIRLSKLISQHGTNMVMSKRQAERCIRDGGVTVAGQQVMSPSFLLNWKDATCSVKVDGKLLQIQQSPRETRVWLVHKLPGEVVSERDPHGRPSLLERLHQSIPSHHLKPVGRLDIMTEGLIIMTNNGALARDLELPKNKVHRTYRVRVHGKLTPYKLKAMRSGITIGNIRYNGMKVEIENTRKKGTSTNTWLRITCTQGKNRQIRNVLAHLASKYGVGAMVVACISLPCARKKLTCPFFLL